jgi:hypothetical protein
MVVAIFWYAFKRSRAYRHINDVLLHCRYLGHFSQDIKSSNLANGAIFGLGRHRFKFKCSNLLAEFCLRLLKYSLNVRGIEYQDDKVYFPDPEVRLPIRTRDGA